MTVVIYYINGFYKNRIRFIALRQLYGSYYKENQAEFFIQIIKEFDFADRLGYFITNHVGSNDTYIDYIFKKLKYILTLVQRFHRCLRYYSHILNFFANIYL